MMKPARVKQHWSGDYTVLDPGQYQGQEIIKPCLVYEYQEILEIADDIAAKAGKKPGLIIEILPHE